MTLSANPGMTTRFDAVADAMEIPGVVETGSEPAFMVIDGVVRGGSILARCVMNQALLGFKIADSSEDLLVTLTVGLDNAGHKWWIKRADGTLADSMRARHVLVACQGVVVGGFTVSGYFCKREFRFRVPAELLDSEGLLMIELDAVSPAGLAQSQHDSLVGMRIDSIAVAPWNNDVETVQVFSDDRGIGAEGIVQGTIVKGAEPTSVKLQLTEQPPISQFMRKRKVTLLLARVLRKLGVLVRKAIRKFLPVTHLNSASGAKEVAVVAALEDGTRVPVQWKFVRRNRIELSFGEGPVPTNPIYFQIQVPKVTLRKAGYSTYVAWRPVLSHWA